MGRNHDPNIPRRGSAQPGSRMATISYGYFVDQGGGRVVLAGGKGQTWDLPRVSILMGGFGNPSEGQIKLPRPAVFDPAGNALVEGDRVLILFPDGNHRQPVVIAGVRPVTFDDGLWYNHASEGADANEYLLRLVPQVPAGTGIPAGRVEIRAGHEAETRGAQLDLAVRNDILPTPPRIGLGEVDGPRDQAFCRTDEFLADLKGILDEIIAIGAASAVPTPNATAMKVEIDLPELTPGRKYRSEIIKGE